MRKLIIFVGILFQIRLQHQGKHKCIHSEIAQKFKPILVDLNPQETNIFAALPQYKYEPSTAQHIRFEHDFSQLSRSIFDTNFRLLQFNLRNYIINDVFGTVVDFFQKRVKINRNKGKLILPNYQNVCAEANIPSKYQTEGVDADYILFVTAKNEPNQGYLAYASACMLDQSNRRPIAGMVNINLALMKNDPLEFQGFVKTIIHEILHALAFSPQLFQYWVDSNGQTYNPLILTKSKLNKVGQRIKLLGTPNLVNYARQHLSCQNVDGVPLEDDGGDGSVGAHFERMFLFNEIMTASDMRQEIFSGYSAAVLKDSGWYGFEDSLIEQLFSGKGEGCDWIDGCHADKKFNDFCPRLGQVGCYFDYSSYGPCQNQFLQNDVCNIIQPYSNGDCKIKQGDSQEQQQIQLLGMTKGKDSYCLKSSMIKNGYVPNEPEYGCHTAYCQNGQLSIEVDGQRQQCLQNNQQLNFKTSNFSGSVYCPDSIIKFCKPKYQFCQNYCNQRGYCDYSTGQCSCISGFTGVDCSQQTI